MRAISVRSFTLAERSATVLVRGAEIWIYGAQSRKLLRYQGMAETALRVVDPLPDIATQDGAIGWDGSHLLVADRLTRKVFRVDAASGHETIVMDPATLKFGNYDPALKVVDASIGDIAWHNGQLIVAVQAGYSSAIYGIDLATNTVLSYRTAPGPKPTGVEIDPADGSLYVIDSRNLELRRFAVSGTTEITDLPAGLVDPRGLSIDADRGLWTNDWSTGALLHMRVED